MTLIRETGSRIRQRRTELGMTQGLLARAVAQFTATGEVGAVRTPKSKRR